MTMSLEDIKKRFVQEIKLRAYDDRFIDLEEERDILQMAVKEGLTIDFALRALQQVCEANDYVIERLLDEKAKEMLEQFAADGQVDKKEFYDTVAVVAKAAKGRLSKSAIEKKVKAIMEDNGMVARQGLFKGGKWYDEIA